MAGDLIAKKALLLSLLGILACATTGCPKYFCKSSDQKWASKQCIFYDSNADSIYVDGDRCDKDQVCPVSKAANSTCMTVTTKMTVYPGDKCGSDRDCLGTCNDGRCVGTGLDEVCGPTSPCEPELFCEGKCQKALDEGKECRSSDHCLPGLECFYKLGSKDTDPGECKMILSIDAGVEIDPRNYDSMTNNSPFCKYMYAFENDKNKTICAEALKSENDIPVKCSSPGQSVCRSTKNSVNSGVVTHDCACGLNKEAQAYCHLFPGDKYTKDVLKKFEDWRKSSDFKKYCSKSEYNAIEGCPIAMYDHWNSDDMEELFYYDQKTVNYPELMNADSCVLEVFQPDYVEYKKKYDDDDDDSASLLLLSAAAVFGIIG